jgi:hypothetical protein
MNMNRVNTCHSALPCVFLFLIVPCLMSADTSAPAKEPDSASTSSTAATQPATVTRPWHVSVDSVASDQLSLDVTALYPSLSDKTGVIPGTVCTTQEMTCKKLHLIVQDGVVKDQLKQLHQGDHVQVVYSTATDTTNNENVLKALTVDSVSSTAGVWVILGSAVICLLLYCSLSGFKPQQLIIGEDNRYSNSKFQMALWFFVLITSYIAALWIRVWAAGTGFIGGVSIPNNLLMLSGMSVLTFGGAKAITSTKSGAPGEGTKTTADKSSFFFDLTHDDGTRPTPAQPAKDGQPAVPANPGTAKFDFGDFQMLIITLIAVVTYIVLIFNFFGTISYARITTLPDVDTTLLAAFGLGQGAYLTKKAVGDVGTS